MANIAGRPGRGATVALVLAVVAACGSAAAPRPTTPSSPAPPAAGSAAVAPAPPAADSTGEISSSAEYVRRNEALFAKLTPVMQQPDCVQSATAMLAYLKDNHDDLVRVHRWEVAHPEDDKAFDAAHQNMEGPIVAWMTKCRGNAEFVAAMEKLETLSTPDAAITSSQGYIEHQQHLEALLVAAVQKPDCDQAAAALKAVADRVRDEALQLLVWEQDHPEDKKAYEDSHRDSGQALRAVGQKCGANPAFRDAIHYLSQPGANTPAADPR